ncbi:sirohydrochlorin chelatase [Rhodococcus sp. 15-725-2-2b]|uniref:sirohydrochlorin chelatase n=1 Tax=unclassified Rhodococcus (in: high G+C Gram-positive bacteria) TaxID=192944 RepID=UPI000B9AEAFA|nr:MULTISPECIES: sirohydrochlorin chelatase [unclassified Rhodococcus (in: high G+C Gram-positive bacteria)]OZC64770.1 sirohydrochlorin chelatase [Rhodococcus sp. 06-469-3-2]OZD43601.1 sirohydrochlorin chelatase [Rhodococcus sp. 06-1477-1A]OZE71267.1 sirohydrochlorin chelatase [Rhodococcus sp. 15-725-2-2b]
MSALIAVAHGSRDPRSSAAVHRAVDVLRRRRPDLDVRVAFLDLSEPRVDQVVDDLAAAGHSRIVAVPMLLGKAFHAKVDLPELLDAARTRHPLVSIRQAEVLGDDRLLIEAVRDRIADTGVGVSDSTVGIALAAVGSSVAPANQRTRVIAQKLVAGTHWAGAVTCFATSVSPSPTDAITQLRALGADRIVVAPWFLAPGLLTDRIEASVAGLPNVVHAEVIGAHPAVAELASRRYDSTVARESVASAIVGTRVART